MEISYVSGSLESLDYSLFSDTSTYEWRVPAPSHKIIMNTMITDNDVASWLQPSPRRYSNEWKSRKLQHAKKTSEKCERPVIDNVEQAEEEEILAINPITQEAQNAQDVSNESEPTASKSKPKPQKVQKGNSRSR